MQADESVLDDKVDEVSALQTTLVMETRSSEDNSSLKVLDRQHGFKVLDRQHRGIHTRFNVSHDADTRFNVSHDVATLPNADKKVVEATKLNSVEMTRHARASEATQKPQHVDANSEAIEVPKLEIAQQAAVLQDIENTTSNRAWPHAPIMRTIIPLSIFSFWDVEYKFTLSGISIVFLIVAMRELGLARDWYGKQDFTPQHRWYMKASERLRILVAAADYAFLIPLALNVAKVLGGDVVVSGFLISAFALGVGFGSNFSMKWSSSWSHVSRRRCLVLTLTCTSVCEALLSLLMTVPRLQQAGALTILTMHVRVLAGFCSGWGSSHVFMLGSVCTAQELNKFQQWNALADFMGMGFGLATVAIALVFNNAIQPRDYLAACSGPMLSIGCLQMMTAGVISFTLPLELNQVSYTNDDTNEREEILDYDTDILSANPGDVIASKNREDIAVSGFSAVAMVALVTIGIEAGTSYMMEVQYHWSPQDISIGMTIVFAVVVLIVSFLSICRVHWGTYIDQKISVPLQISCIIATMLYFPILGWKGEYRLFAGDALVYPSVTVVAGMVMGYAVWAAEPEKWNCRENVVETAQVIDASVKFLGAPAVRVMIQLAGRKAYAMMQIILASFMLFTFLWVRNVDMHVDKAVLDEAVPSGRSYFQDLKNKKERFLKNFRRDDWWPDNDEGVFG